jgi:DNA-binding GntR family transcriptional regulator
MPRTPTAVASISAADERVPAAERAYRSLKRLILDNELTAGAQLLEVEAAALLGVSRTPVREAMVRLEQEGMVELRPRHGMRVRPISAADMADIYEVLTALESAAAAAAARKGVTQEAIAPLQRAVLDMEAALEADDRLTWSEADERFHRGLVALSGNTRLINLVEQVWDQAHRARLLTLHLRPKPVASNRDHAAVVEAILARDPEKANLIHQQHRRGAAVMLIDLINRLGFKQL